MLNEEQKEYLYTHCALCGKELGDKPEDIVNRNNAEPFLPFRFGFACSECQQRYVFPARRTQYLWPFNPKLKKPYLKSWRNSRRAQKFVKEYSKVIASEHLESDLINTQKEAIKEGKGNNNKNCCVLPWWKPGLSFKDAEKQQKERKSDNDN